MADEILGFAGFEAAEHNETAANAGASGNVGVIRKDGSNSTCALVTSPALAGTYTIEVSPVNGDVLDRYGPVIACPGSPAFIAVMFIWRFTEAGGAFDDQISICEYSKDSTTRQRRLIMNTNEALEIQDTDGDQIDKTGDSYVAVDTDYPMYWYINLFGTTRDILWVYKSGAWDKAIDASGHGDVGTFGTDQRVTFGSGTGKTIPTQGGPMYYDECCAVANPTATGFGGSGLGSASCKYLAANGDGADTGEWDDHDYQDVDELPADLDGATINSASAVGQKQSYDVAAPGETPLALQVVGAAGGSDAATYAAKPYIFDGTNRDYGDSLNYGDIFRNIRQGAAKTTLPDGNPITESAVNDLEVGMEIDTIPSGTFQLDQIGLEYMVAGAQALPSDFPTDVGTGVEVGGVIGIF